MRVAIVSHRSSATNLALATRSWNGVQPELLSPREALLRLGGGDRALARLDVRDDLDGIEEGLWAPERLVDGGVSILNRPPSLLRAHDKLLTARTLRRAGLRTNVALGASVAPATPSPVASRLALEAAAASGLDLVGVDLLPTGPGGYTVLELNGAVDFRPIYSFSGRNVFDDTVAALTGGKAAGLALEDA